MASLSEVRSVLVAQAIGDLGRGERGVREELDRALAAMAVGGRTADQVRTGLPAARRDGRASWPDYARELQSASAVIVPSLVLAEVDHFLRDERRAMRKLVGEILDPRTRYELEPLEPRDLVRALEFDARFASLRLGLVDGMVAAVAERRGVHRVLTADRRDFGAISIGVGYDRPLDLVP